MNNFLELCYKYNTLLNFKTELPSSILIASLVFTIIICSLYTLNHTSMVISKNVITGISVLISKLVVLRASLLDVNKRFLSCYLPRRYR